VPSSRQVFVPRNRLGSRSKSLIRDRGVATHHLLALPTAQSPDDRPGEARVECHGCAVVPQIMKVEVAETSGLRRSRNTRLTRTRL
jgi:hypothetical protein